MINLILTTLTLHKCEEVGFRDDMSWSGKKGMSQVEELNISGCGSQLREKLSGRSINLIHTMIVKPSLYVVFQRKDDVVQKGREEIVQQRTSERPVGEESPERGGPVQTGGRIQAEKLP